MPSPTEAQQGAVAALVAAEWAAPAPPGPAPDEAAQRVEAACALRCELELERQRADAEVQHYAQHQADLRQQLDDACEAAEQQHQAIAASLATLAGRLGWLSTAGGNASAPCPLLSLGVAEGYAMACSTLLDGLAGYVEHHFPSGGGGDGGPAAAMRHQRRCRELEQLQRGLCKAEWLRVSEEAELARLQVELGVLQAPGANAAASLGYSTADLEAEVASLQRRRATSLPLALAATEAAAAKAAGEGIVAEQCAQREAELVQRLEAKQQVASMLARHLARQLLIRQLLQHEQAALQQVLAAALAARGDAKCVVQVALSRMPGYEAQQAADEQHASTPAAAAAADADLSQAGSTDALSTAQQLVECRAELQRLAQQVHGQLPQHHAMVAQLARLLYGAGADGSGIGEAPQLSAPQLQSELAAAEAAHQALQLQAHAVMAEVGERQRAPEARQLAEQVLLAFWGEGEGEGSVVQLQALADKQQQRLERHA